MYDETTGLRIAGPTKTIRTSDEQAVVVKRIFDGDLLLTPAGSTDLLAEIEMERFEAHRHRETRTVIVAGPTRQTIVTFKEPEGTYTVFSESRDGNGTPMFARRPRVPLRVQSSNTVVVKE